MRCDVCTIDGFPDNLNVGIDRCLLDGCPGSVASLDIWWALSKPELTWLGSLLDLEPSSALTPCFWSRSYLIVLNEIARAKNEPMVIATLILCLTLPPQRYYVSFVALVRLFRQPVVRVDQHGRKFAHSR